MHPKNAAIAVAAVCVALGASAAAAEAPPSGQSPAPTQAPQAVPGVAPSTEGPTGRTLLSRWTLATDPSNRGLARGWQRGSFPGRAVTVPNDVDPTHYKGRSGQRNYEGSIAWYRTSFTATSAATYAFAFSSANFQATAYVDGKAIASHHGSYLPFEGRAALTAGQHTLVVRIDWRNPGQQSLQGFHRTWFNWGGLNGPVTVRAIGQSELLEPSIATTLQPDSASASQATVRIGVHVRNDGPTRSLQPSGTLANEGRSFAVQFPAQTVAAGATASFTTSVAVADPAVWSPSKPSLYELKLTLGANGSASTSTSGSEVAGSAAGESAQADESGYFARVGLRQLSWHAGRMLLNGRQLKLHGASIQEDVQGDGDALTPADQNKLVAELKAIGANAVRSQHPLDPALLERLDAAGLLVWQGIGPVEGASEWHSSTPQLNREAEQQARAAAIAAMLHPSIIAWNLVDEVAHNGHDGAEVSYVQTLTNWLHERDTTRMVAVDVWGDHPPVHAGTLYRSVDAVAETDYTGWYDSPQDSDAQQRALMRARLRAQERTFAGKVLIVSEFGAESNTLNAAGAPGSYSFQSALLARHIAVYSADPKLSGMLVWDLNDYPLVPTFEGGSIHFKLPSVKLIEGINQKGLFTYSGAAKPAAGAVARLFKALPRD